MDGSSEIHHGNHNLRLRLHHIQHCRRHMGSRPSLSNSNAHPYLYQPAKLRLQTSTKQVASLLGKAQLIGSVNVK